VARTLALILGTAMLVAPGAVPQSTQGGIDWASARRRMVDTQLEARDITNPAVLGAMTRVP
jgi:hypothetical protein